ncbi:MAG: hypothetical protein RIC56_19250 [Pseudomonadales bacterium]
MSTAQAATVQSLSGGSIVVGRLTVGWLVDRYWAPGVAALTMTLPVLGCWLLIEPAGFATAGTAAVLIGLAAGARNGAPGSSRTRSPTSSASP